MTGLPKLTLRTYFELIASPEEQSVLKRWMFISVLKFLFHK